MRNAVLTLAAAAMLAGVAPAALAQPVSADVADARCLIVLQFVGRDPKQAEQASKGIYFYLGRFSARGAIARLEGIVKTEATKMQPQQAQVELQRCSNELNSRGQEFQAVNQRLAATFAPKAPAKK